MHCTLRYNQTMGIQVQPCSVCGAKETVVYHRTTAALCPACARAHMLVMLGEFIAYLVELEKRFQQGIPPEYEYVQHPTTFITQTALTFLAVRDLPGKKKGDQ